jgi:GDP-L-fucose synthase
LKFLFSPNGRLKFLFSGYAGEVVHDRTKPDGTPRKLMDSGRLAALGWAPQIALDAGIADAYQHYLAAAA